MKLAELIRFEEGYSNVPYICSEGYVTIGFGTKLYNHTGVKAADFPIMINKYVAEELLHIEVSVKETRLMYSDVGEIYKDLNDDRRAIILSMSYQMGVSGVLAFKNMWKALKVGDFHLANAEMFDSKWAKQTPERAKRHAIVMLTGSFEGVYE